MAAGVASHRRRQFVEVESTRMMDLVWNKRPAQLSLDPLEGKGQLRERERPETNTLKGGAGLVPTEPSPVWKSVEVLVGFLGSKLGI